MWTTLAPCLVALLIANTEGAGPTKCGLGYKHVPAAGGADSKCTACVGTTFNDRDDPGPNCQNHKNCYHSSWKTAGTDRTDSVCTPITVHKCAKGFKWVAFAGAGTAAASCKACEAKTFKVDDYLRPVCIAHKTCSSSSTKNAGTTSADAVCNTVTVTKCAAGNKFVAYAGTGTAAAKCTACGAKTFNAKDDLSATCAAHKTCSGSTVKTAGTSSTDAVCNPVVTKCAAGSKFVAKAGAKAAECKACDAKTFNAKDDLSATCAAHKTCSSSSTKNAGTTSADAVCNTVTVTKCAAGSKFVAYTGTAAATCDTCGAKTFNAKDDLSATCAAHNTCSDTTVKTAGTKSADAVCNAEVLGTDTASGKFGIAAGVVTVIALIV